MSAKFIAQIEISKPCVSSESAPAEATRPRIVSISGNPAATSEPNASTRIASVTGQLKSSDFIIAVRFAVLKSLHIPDAPVSETLDAGGAGRLQLRLQLVGDRDHCGRVTLRAGHHDRGVAVGGDRRSGAGRHDRGDFRARAEQLLDARDGGSEGWIGRRLAWRVDDNHQRRAREPAEVGLDQLSRLHRLRAVRLPPRPGERGLDLRREEAEPDRDDDPGDRDGAEVIGGPAAEPADRADCLGVLGRNDPGAELRRDGGHEPTAPISSWSEASCRWREPHTSSQRANTPSSTTL